MTDSHADILDMIRAATPVSHQSKTQKAPGVIRQKSKVQNKQKKGVRSVAGRIFQLEKFGIPQDLILKLRHIHNAQEKYSNVRIRGKTAIMKKLSRTIARHRSHLKNKMVHPSTLNYLTVSHLIPTFDKDPVGEILTAIEKAIKNPEATKEKNIPRAALTGSDSFTGTDCNPTPNFIVEFTSLRGAGNFRAKFYGIFRNHSLGIKHPFGPNDVQGKRGIDIMAAHDASHSVAMVLPNWMKCEFIIFNYVPITYPESRPYFLYYTQSRLKLPVVAIVSDPKINTKNPKHKKSALRRTYASYLLDQGVKISIISRLLGHASIRTTMVYLYDILEPEGYEIIREVILDMNKV